MEVVTHWFQEVPALASFHVTNWLSTFFKNIHELALSRRVTTKRAAATPVLRRSCFTKFTYKGVCRLKPSQRFTNYSRSRSKAFQLQHPLREMRGSISGTKEKSPKGASLGRITGDHQQD